MAEKNPKYADWRKAITSTFDYGEMTQTRPMVSRKATESDTKAATELDKPAQDRTFAIGSYAEQRGRGRGRGYRGGLRGRGGGRGGGRGRGGRSNGEDRKCFKCGENHHSAACNDKQEIKSLKMKLEAMNRAKSLDNKDKESSYSTSQKHPNRAFAVENNNSQQTDPTVNHNSIPNCNDAMEVDDSIPNCKTADSRHNATSAPSDRTPYTSFSKTALFR